MLLLLRARRLITERRHDGVVKTGVGDCSPIRGHVHIAECACGDRNIARRAPGTPQQRPPSRSRLFALNSFDADHQRQAPAEAKPHGPGVIVHSSDKEGEWLDVVEPSDAGGGNPWKSCASVERPVNGCCTSETPNLAHLMGRTTAGRCRPVKDGHRPDWPSLVGRSSWSGART